MGTGKPLSAWRFRLSIQKDLVSREAREEGAAFAAVRRSCGLGLIEVAHAWGPLDVLEVAHLEDGRRSFPSPADFHAALSQLWLWGSERGVLR